MVVTTTRLNFYATAFDHQHMLVTIGPERGGENDMRTITLRSSYLQLQRSDVSTVDGGVIPAGMRVATWQERAF